MDIDHNQAPEVQSAAQLVKLEIELIQIKSHLKMILNQGLTKADLLRWDTNIYEAISKSAYRIILLLCTLIILSHAVYPIIYSCP